jgi:hypothetical protein
MTIRFYQLPRLKKHKAIVRADLNWQKSRREENDAQ